MKNIILILILLSGCQVSKKVDPTRSTMSNSTKIRKGNSEKADYFKNVRQTNGIFKLSDLYSDFNLVFGSASNQNEGNWENMTIDSLKGYIVNPSYDEFSNLRELKVHYTSFGSEKDILPICNIEPSTLIIPFNSSEDAIVLTTWEKIDNETIQFKNIIIPGIDMRYSAITSIELIKKDHLVLLTQGGDGGENWTELIIVKVIPPLRLNILDRIVAGFCHDCGDIAKLSYQKDGNNLSVFETRDSMKIVDDKWVKLTTKKKVIKKIEI